MKIEFSGDAEVALREAVKMTGRRTGNAGMEEVVAEAMELYLWVLGQQYKGNPVHAHYGNSKDGGGIHRFPEYIKDVAAAEKFFGNDADFLNRAPERPARFSGKPRKR